MQEFLNKISFGRIAVIRKFDGDEKKKERVKSMRDVYKRQDEYNHSVITFVINGRKVSCPRFVQVNGELEPDVYKRQVLRYQTAELQHRQWRCLTVTRNMISQ